MSQRGVAYVLDDIKKNGLPDSFSRTQQRRNRKKHVYFNTPYGKLLETKTLKVDGADLDVAFLNPFAWLYHTCQECDVMKDAVEQAHRAAPSSPSNPWTIVMYQDGVDPGDTAVKEKSRHSIVFYWSFLEFGMGNLCREELWGAVWQCETP